VRYRKEEGEREKIFLGFLVKVYEGYFEDDI